LRELFEIASGTVRVKINLSDPSRKMLIEAGRGVPVQAGQDFHLISTRRLFSRRLKRLFAALRVFDHRQ
jgi:mannose-6-phosphate isomerase-like protein (cupin superfamily)